MISRLVDRLLERRDVQTAARVAYTFHLDPVEILKSDVFDQAVRITAHEVVVADENRRNDKAKEPHSR